MAKEKKESEHGKMKNYWSDIFSEGKKVKMILSLVLPEKEVSDSGQVVIIPGVEIESIKFCVFKYESKFYLGKFDDKQKKVTIVGGRMEKAIYEMLLNAPKEEERIIN
jgi:hypothetical protein